MKYTVEFDRIGRSRPLPLVVDTDKGDIGAQILSCARPHLVSRDVVVHYSVEEGRGFILCGFQNGGDFTIEATQ